MPPALLLLALWACKQAQPPAEAPDAAARTAGEAPTAEQERRPRRRFGRSGRCGECHEQMRRDWLSSAHARAVQSTAYQTALLRLGEAARGACAPCHMPGLAFGEEGTPDRPGEGVACDGCHTIAGVQVGTTGAVVRFDLESGRKYGPLVGPASNYFHGMAQSELHRRADLCAACHHLMSFTLGGKARGVPVVTDYDGWRRYGRGRPCQECHMPSRGAAAVARGGRVRPDVPSHAFPGAQALGRQLRLEVSLDPRTGQLTVELTHGAGHPLPSGLVDRRLLMRVAFGDRTGADLGSEERSYGIFLVDGEGRPAPFFRAVAIKEDRRLLPERTHSEIFVVPAGAVRANISLLAAPTAPELAESYGEPDLAVVKSVALPLARLRRPRGEAAEAQGAAQGADR